MSPSIASAFPVLARWRRIPGPPRDVAKARLLRLYRALRDRFGPPGGRPGRTPFEVAVTVILTRNPASTNAVLAIAALRRERLLSARALDRVGEARLGRVLRSSGASRRAARRLKAFTRWLVEQHGGRLDTLRRVPLASLRASLLAVPGLGAGTTDAILLYAAHRPVFVADAVARRALARQHLLRASAGYEAARRFVEGHLPSDPALFDEFHALLSSEGGFHSEGGFAPATDRRRGPRPPSSMPAGRKRGPSPRSKRPLRRRRR